MSDRLIQSIERAADILELFLRSPEQSVKEISQQLELSKSTVHGIIKTLEYRGYLQQNSEDLKYKLGLKVFELGNAFSNHIELRKIARPVIENLVAQLKETVHLVIFQRDEIIYVEKVEGPHTLRIYSQVGKRAPVHCTGVGKAILAFQDDDEIERILSKSALESFTINTLTNVEEIKKELQIVRERGYAIDDEEIEVGLKCIAAPIFNHQRKVTASISCASPVMRLDEERIDAVIQGIKTAAAQISSSMGYQVQLARNEW